ncbi:MAG: site-specific integrase, partial [Muribaculum sp.]|nr:site-specific integrase [Muribaculum sp.]
MARKTKEPVKIRFKELNDGCKSIYLDIYLNGKRKYEFLKLYINPGTDKQTLLANEEAMRMAEAIKAERIVSMLKPEDSKPVAPVILPDTSDVDEETADARKRAKRTTREPVTLRNKKLMDGRMSLYLDIYYKGKRSYEFLKLYMHPEESDVFKKQNEETLAQANEIRMRRLQELVLEDEPVEEVEQSKPKEKKFKIVLNTRTLRTGGKSYYIYIYYGEHFEKRSWESLGLYIRPTDTEEQIRKIKAKAKAIKRQKEEELRNGSFVPKRDIAIEIKEDLDHYKRFVEERRSIEECETVKREKKRNTRTKEPVRIRFKNLANGSKSIYLAINANGKRSYEYLKLYLIPETDASAKAQNKHTMEAVYAIKAQRIIELTNRAAGIQKDVRINMRLLDWLDVYRDRQIAKGHPSVRERVSATKVGLTRYAPDITLEEIDRQFFIGFANYLKTEYRTYKNTQPSQGTVDNYIAVIKAAINVAVEEEIMRFNPGLSYKRTRVESPRQFLTIEEVKKMIDTPCRRMDIKTAFLFSCFCGLRISDVRRLKWGDIHTDGDGMRIEITQYKTKRPLLLPLNKQAQRWLPERGEKTDDDPVFPPLSENMEIIAQWAKDAGIKKHVTYHVSRHTFATMELTMGADLYTTSKLLGHTSVNTTQI